VSKGGGGIGVGMDGDKCAFGGLVLLGVPLLLLLLGAHYYFERREKSRVASGEGRKKVRDWVASLFPADHLKCSSTKNNLLWRA